MQKLKTNYLSTELTMSILNSKAKIAVLITCFNRKKKTLSCIQKLKQQKVQENIEYNVFLLDDGSTDGTGDAVKQKFPDVTLITAKGNLYWNRGMRVVWKYAQDYDNFDYYLLLNDDTDLHDAALMRLIETEKHLKKQGGKSCIIVGSISDPVDGHITYGGVVRARNYFGIKFTLVSPSKVAVPCDTFNANCVLISRQISCDVGVLSDKFAHSMGDTDYGLRAAECGYECYVAPGIVGSCTRNETSNTWQDEELSLKERKKLLFSPKGRPPDEWRYFVRRHAGRLWVLAWLQLYMRLYFPRFWKTLRKLRGRDE